MSGGFKRLANKVAREYEKKGVPAPRAKLYGKETAAKVYHEQHGLGGQPLHHGHMQNGRVKVLY